MRELPVQRKQKVSYVKGSMGYPPGFRVRRKCADGCAPPPDEIYDSIIVGGGVCGLTAAHSLSGRKILLLEANPGVGGFISYGHRGDLFYPRGAVYITKPVKKLARLMRQLGLPRLSLLRVPQPTDSYLLRGEFVVGMCKQGIDNMPAGYARFVGDLKGITPLIPAVEHNARWSDFSRRLDRITAAQFIKHYGREAKTILDLYSRSVFGGTTDKISALAFLDFYADEIGTKPKYEIRPGPGGLLGAFEKVLKNRLQGRLVAGAVVKKVRNRKDGNVEVVFRLGGSQFKRVAKTVVVATSLREAGKIVPEMPESKTRIIDSMEWSSHLVHNVIVPESIFKKSYGAWAANRSFVDFIAARWKQTKGFTVQFSGEDSMTVYQPLPESYWGKILSWRKVKQMAARMFKQLRAILPDLKNVPEVVIESSQWPTAFHIVRPGFLSKEVSILKRPDGGIYYASHNLTMPCVEGAINVGLAAARKVKNRLAAHSSLSGSVPVKGKAT